MAIEMVLGTLLDAVVSEAVALGAAQASVVPEALVLMAELVDMVVV